MVRLFLLLLIGGVGCVRSYDNTPSNDFRSHLSGSILTVSSGRQLEEFTKSENDIAQVSKLHFLGISRRDDLGSIQRLHAVEEICFYYCDLTPQIIDDAVRNEMVSSLKFFECRNIESLLKRNDIPKSIRTIELGSVGGDTDEQIRHFKDCNPGVTVI